MDFFLLEERLLPPAHSSAAIIVLEDGRLLMQERDRKRGIFYPGHWGLFGGAMNGGENPEQALYRELREELDIKEIRARHFTDFSFGFGRFGQIRRHFFEVSISSAELKDLTLSEGRAMRAFLPNKILTMPRVVPYDSFAIFLYHAKY